MTTGIGTALGQAANDKGASDGSRHLDKITPTVLSQEVNHMLQSECHDVTKSSCVAD